MDTLRAILDVVNVAWEYFGYIVWGLPVIVWVIVELLLAFFGGREFGGGGMK